MKRTLSIILVILFALVGTVGATDAETIEYPIQTNVIFCKLHLEGESYSFEPLLTLYEGRNDWGRHTFLTGAANLTPGDYALVQINDGKMDILNFLAVDYTGTVIPAYTLLSLQLRDDELAGPLGYYTQSAPSSDTPAVSDLPSTEITITITPGAAAPMETTAKSPVSPLMVLAGLGIAGLICAMRIRK